MEILRQQLHVVGSLMYFKIIEMQFLIVHH